MKRIENAVDVEAPGSESRQRQIARSRRLLNTVREEFTRSRARRLGIARRKRARGVTSS